MPTLFATMLKSGTISPQSIRSIAFSLLDKLKGKMPQLVFVFTNPTQDIKAVLKSIREVIPAHIVGALSNGTIFSQMGIVRQGIAIGAIYSTDMRFVVLSGRGIEQDTRRCVEPLFHKIFEFHRKSLSEGFPYTSILMFVGSSRPDVGDDIADFIWELDIPPGMQIVGGISNSGVIFKSNEFNNGVIVVAISSRRAMGVGADFGLIKVSQEPHLATKVHGNVIEEIDGRPALDVFMDDLSQQETSVSEMEDVMSKFMISFESVLSDVPEPRAVIGTTDNGGLILGGRVPRDAKLFVCQAVVDSLSEAACRAAAQAKLLVYQKVPSGAVVFEDTARFRASAERFSKELFKIYTEINVPMLGCDFQGQISKGPGMPIGFHNASVVTFTFSS